MEIYQDGSLTAEDQIIQHFKDCGFEFFDCGQGYYQEQADTYVKIGDQYFYVMMTAEMDSRKQDRGDRMYWVDCITEVTYEKVSEEEINERKKAHILIQISGHEKKIADLKLELDLI